VVLCSGYTADLGEPYPVDFVESCDSLTAAEKKAILGANTVALSGIEVKTPS